MKRISFLAILIITLFAGVMRAQVTVTATAATTGPTVYTTLGAAFTAINAGTHQGAITIDISATTAEAGPCILNSNAATPASYTSVLIFPSVDGVSISGATASGRGVIELKGADNVTIDGDNPNTAGINRNLTIINTAANTVTYTSCIRIATAATVVTSADNITIKNCIINGSATGRNLAAATSATGSENTTFGIYAGGNGGATAVDAPTAINNVTTNTAPVGTTINTLLISNNAVNACARGVEFTGANISVSNNVTISDNLIGDQGTLAGNPPYTAPTTTVYTKGVFVAGVNNVTVSGNSIKTIVSYVATPVVGIDINTLVGTPVISNNTITGVVLNVNSANPARGISLTVSASPYTISGNTITNVQNFCSSATTTNQPSAMYINTAAASGTIEKNIVTTVIDRNTGTFGVGAVVFDAGNNITFRNNFISDVNQDMSGGVAFSIYGVQGLRINGGTGHKIYHNSINLTGALIGTATTANLTACLSINSALTGIDVRNNIFANRMTGGTTSIAHVSIFLPSGATAAMGLTLNNNAYFCGTTVASQGIAQVGTTAGTGFYLPANFIANATVPATNLRSYTSTLSGTGTNDNNSFAFNTVPPFVSSSNLHIPAAAPTPLESSGAVIGVTSDIDNDVRPGPVGSVNGGGTAPDMGADEFDGIFTDVFAPAITYTPLSPTCSTGDRIVTGVTITDAGGVPVAGVNVPRIYYKKGIAGTYFSQPGTLASGTGNNGVWNFTIVVSDMGGVVIGDQIFYYVIAQDLTANISSNASGVSATSVNAVVTPPATAASYFVSTTMAGTYTVGVSGAFPTLTAAVTAYNNSCIGGPILFSLIDATYPSETFPITVLTNAYASAVNTLTIKPAVGVSPTITGSNAVAILRLNGADYVTIDGSNAVSGTTRDLTIRNTNAGTSSIVVWISCATASDGASNNTVKNCTVLGNSNTTTLACIISSSGVTAGGVAETANPNNTYMNNAISTSFYGMGVVGPTGNESGSVITGNSIGSTIAANKIGFQSIFVAQEQNVTVTDNIVAGVSSTSTANPNCAGIHIAGSISGGSVLRNKISDIKNTNTSGYGAYGIVLNSSSVAANLLVADNFISDVTGFGFAGSGINDNGYGIAVNAGGGFNIYSNTVLLNTNPSAAGSRTAALWINTGLTAGSLDIRNNIFANTMTVGAVAQRHAIFCAGTNAVFSTINYNDFYSTGTNIGSVNATNCATLATIQTNFGGNANSVNVLPVFVSATDLHLVAGSNPLIEDKGTAIAAVPADIDGQVRHGCQPDIGADEFGIGPQEANVNGNAVSVVDGDITPSAADFTDFGTQSVCSGTIVRTFTIENTGGSTLTVSSVNITGANAADFVVTTPPAATVAPAGNTTFSVTFDPSAAGTRTATITINTNDCDEAAYDFAIQGSGTQITASIASQTNVTCNAGNNGAATIATLGGMPTVTYLWAPSGNTAATETGLIAGTYTCTVSDVNGCTAIQLVTITEPAPLVITASTVSPSICDGSSATLTATGGATYAWMPGSLSGSSVSVSPSTTTTYTVTGINGAGCSGTDVVTITVDPLPSVTATAGSASICNGSSTTLTGNGAATYSWMPGSLSGTVVSVSPTTTTTYTVTGTSGSGCVNTDVVTVTVNPLPTVTANSTAASVCTGGSVTLTGGGATSYTWTGGVTNGVSFVPASTLTYTVTGTDGNGCQSTANTTVTVNPLPTVTATAGSASICTGSSTTLTGNNATTYTWMPGSLSGTTVSVSPTATTTYTVTGTNGNGCVNTNVVTVTVNPLPAVTATAGSASICTGSSTTLTGNNATTYTWMPGSLSGTTVSVSPTATTTYTVTGTNGNGCVNTNVVTVTVNPLPSVTATAGSASICTGSSTTLTGNNATTYTWMPGSLSGTTVSVSPTATTTYTVTGTNGNGCVNTNVVTVTVNPLPTVTATAGSASICTGSSTTLTGNNATTYTWMPGSLSGTTVSVSPTSTTTYTVTGTNGNGCVNTGNVTVTVNPLPSVTATAGSASICTGSSTTLTGNNATTYTWMPGSLSGTTVSVSPTATTTYTVTGTNGNGCVNTNVVTVTVNPLPPVNASASSTSICSGNTVTLTGSGATTYSWMPGSLSGTVVTTTPVATTTYTLTGTDVNGCVNTGNVTITVGAQPTVTASASTNPICIGSSTTLTGNGAATYTWMPGSLSGTSVSVSPTTSTTYTVTGVVSAGCQNTGIVTVTVNPLPTVTASSTAAAVCTGNSVTLTGGGATTYTWTGGATNGVAFVPASTLTYTVTGTDANGCVNTASTAVTVNPLPTVTASSTAAAVCTGGSVTLTGGGATTYTWTGGVTNGVAFVPASTLTYTVTGTNGNGCQNTASTTVTVNPLPTVTANSTATAVCIGGSVTLTGGGATTYTWTGGVTNGVAFVPPSTNSYTVTGTNSNGCVNTATISVIVNPLPTVTANSTATAVCTGNSVTLTGGGATTYTWTGGVTNNVAFVPPATNSYTVTGTNVNGCVNTATISVTVNPLPTVTANSTAAAVCAGSSVTLTGGGATTYTWTGGVTDGVSFIPASTLTYIVTGTNGNGCQNTASTTVTVNPMPTVTATAGSASICNGSSTTLTGNGATTYTWAPGPLSGTTVTVNPTSTTIYTVTGTTSFGCVGTGTVSVTVNPLPVVTVTGTNNFCAGGSTTLTGTGGGNHQWYRNGVLIPGATAVTYVATTAGVYNMIKINLTGCYDSAAVGITVIVNPLPTVTASSTASAVCSGNSVTLTGGGATTYTWTGSVTDNVAFTPVATDTYTVTGTDGNGCQNTASVMVTVNALPTVTASSTAAAVCDGSPVTLNGGGATSYTWTGSVTDNVAFTPVATDSYTVTGTDGNGCQNTASVTVTVNPLPTVTANSTAAAVCDGSSVTLTGGGATTYTWTGSVTDNVAFTPLATDSYTVTGTDGNGCQNTASVTVTVNPLPTVVANSTAAAVCAGSPVTLTGSGTTSYSWSGSVVDGVAFVPTTTDTYTVTGTDGNSCSNTATITVTVNPLPLVDIGPDMAQCSGTVLLDAQNAGSTYMWNDNTTAQTLTASTTGIYWVDVTDVAGCSMRDSVSITINTNPVVTLGVDTVQCGGTITLDAGNAGATYLWSDNTTNQTLTVSAGGIYSVVATLTGGCTATDTIMVTINTPPVVTLSFPMDTVCFNGGMVALSGETPTGGTWSGTGVSGSTFDPQVAGLGWDMVMYSVTDTNGCTTSLSDSLNVDVCNGIAPVVAENNVTVYPNPNMGQFTIELNTLSSSPVKVELTDELGQVIETFTMNNTTQQVNISYLAAGVYILRITDGTHVSVRRVVKQ